MRSIVPNKAGNKQCLVKTCTFVLRETLRKKTVFSSVIPDAKISVTLILIVCTLGKRGGGGMEEEEKRKMIFKLIF